jgi:hypothetical protein
MEIPSSQYRAFSEGLMALGEMEPSGPAPGVEKASVKVRITVIVSGK